MKYPTYDDFAQYKENLRVHHPRSPSAAYRTVLLPTLSRAPAESQSQNADPLFESNYEYDFAGGDR